MKGKSKYLVLLLLLLVVCSGLVTYALFRTNKSGNATVNAARWNIVFKNGETEIEDNFNIQLSNATWTNELGNVASGKIAPGSSATFYITIDATNTETSVDYTAEIDESFDESDFEVTLAQDSGTIPYSTVENAMIRQIPIRVVWNGNINDSNTKNNDDLLKKARNITIPIKLTAAQKLALKYTITFNDGAGNTISSKKVDEGSAVGTLPANPTRIGYTFDGWYDDPTNGSQVTSETLVNQGMNIYAHWTIKYVTVSFNSDGGSSVASIPIREGSSFENSNINIPTSTKEDYNFNNWYDSNNNELTTSTVIMSNITYTANWINQYTRTGTLVYYDPVNSSTCNSSTFNLTNVKNGTSTCYKWRIIKEDLNSATIQLDHNLIDLIEWNSDGNSNHGPVTVLTSLSTSTSSWTRVLGLNYTYNTSASSQNYGILSCVNGTCTISKTNGQISNVKARLITAEEVAKITQTQTSGNTVADNWSLSNQSPYYFYISN